MLIHATAIAINGQGILLTGPTMSGKSDLALRAIDAGAVLIGDDLVQVALSPQGLVILRPPASSPLLTVRGIGMITPNTVLPCAPLSLCVRLDPQVDRTALFPVLGHAGPWHGRFAPAITLFPFEPSATLKLALAVERYGF